MKKGAYSKLIIILIVTLNITFTIAVLAVFRRTGSEPSTLIVSWFSFTTIELVAMAGIKIKKVKKESDNDDTI